MKKYQRHRAADPDDEFIGAIAKSITASVP